MSLLCLKCCSVSHLTHMRIKVFTLIFNGLYDLILHRLPFFLSLYFIYNGLLTVLKQEKHTPAFRSLATMTFSPFSLEHSEMAGLFHYFLQVSAQESHYQNIFQANLLLLALDYSKRAGLLLADTFLVLAQSRYSTGICLVNK